MDRDILAEVYEAHFVSRDSGFCRCGFRVSNTEPGDRDHERGWNTSAPHMRKMYARHLADEYTKAVNGNG